MQGPGQAYGRPAQAEESQPDGHHRLAERGRDLRIVPDGPGAPKASATLAKLERKHIERAPRLTGGRVAGAKGAAALLAAPRSTLLRRMKWLGVKRSRAPKEDAAAAIVKRAIETGELGPGRTLLDSTSGNTGIAYAMLGAMLDFKVGLCLPSDAVPETRKILAAYRAVVIETDPILGSDGAQRRAEEMAESRPDEYFLADQYNNESNWLTHFETTGTEIWWQTGGRTTHFVAGLGTSGTFTGVSLKLKEYAKDTVCVAVQPDSPLHGIDGVRDFSVSRRPGFYDPALADLTIRVTTSQAREAARWLARTQGLLTGVSSGANVHAALKVAADLPSDAVVVTVLCDSGLRYLGTPLWGPAAEGADP